MNQELDGVMRRIEKLLAIANCPGADPNEAAAAAGMAERIMRKYQIEHSAVIISALRRGNDMEQADCVVTAKTNGTPVERVPLWANILGTQVAALCEVGAGVARGADYQVCYRFFGFAIDVRMASWMLNYLVGVVNSLCDEFKKHDYRYIMRGRKAVNEYRMGLVRGICYQMITMIEEREKEFSTNSGKELTIVKNSAIEEHFGSDIFKTKKSVSKVNRESSASASGFVDGTKVDVNRRGLEGENNLAIGKD